MNYVLKNIKFFIFIIFLLIFSNISNISYSIESSTCKFELNNFQKYKVNLLDCIKENGETPPKDLLVNLSEKTTSFLSNDNLKKFLKKDTLIVNKRFNAFLKKTTKKNYLSFYGIHREIDNLRVKKIISNEQYNNLIQNSLTVFSKTVKADKKNISSTQLIQAAAALLVVDAISGETAEGKTLTFSLSAASLAENSGSTVTLTATTTKAVTSDTVVNITLGGGATNNIDYATSASTLTILSGNKTGSLTFTLTDDSIYEGDETISFSTASISGDSEYTSSSPTASFTILENESAPVITMSAASNTITENSGSNIVLTFTSSQVSDEDITISLSTSGTSSEGTDYSSLSDVTISANSTSNTLNFTPTDDSIYEGDETAIISIDTVLGSDATENASQSVTITITENETAPTLTLTSSASSIAENSGSSLNS